ncbi:MAG: hypothetical protein GEU76_03850 [Alphaproteobacteria bacterium]|nr:hypothetical protein [Alphaproteobacteria bacterium]
MRGFRRWPVFLLIGLAACSGAMKGGLHTPDGKPLGVMELAFQSNGFGGGTLTGTLPDGERVTGNFAEIRRSGLTTGYATTGQETVWLQGTTSESSQQFEGVLNGDRGTSMHCLFRGTASNGVGRCLAEDGRRALLSW